MFKRPRLKFKLTSRHWWLVSSGMAVVVLMIIFSSQLESVFSRLWIAVGYGTFFPTSTLNHEQAVWLSALEWCESSGVPSKINKKDLDGTPSYFAFQFKPSTFKMYGIKYGMFPKNISDEQIKNLIDNYSLQKKLVSLMIDDSSINWRREFPDCVRKLGRPPLGE